MEWTNDAHLPQLEKEDTKIDIQSPEETIKIEENVLMEVEAAKPPTGHVSLLRLNQELDEFFDVPEADEFLDYDRMESDWSPEPSSPVLTGSPILSLFFKQLLRTMWQRNLY